MNLWGKAGNDLCYQTTRKAPRLIIRRFGRSATIVSDMIVGLDIFVRSRELPAKAILSAGSGRKSQVGEE